MAGPAIRAVTGMMAALMTAGLLSGCATGLLDREDRARVCGVAVVMPSDPYVPLDNLLANPAGGVTGLGLGAISVLAAVANPLLLIVAPMVVAEGMMCSAGSVSHPNAAADFQAIYRSVSAQALAAGVERQVEASRGGCAPAAVSPAAKPGAIVEIAGIGVRPGCAYDDWKYFVSVTWRVKRVDGGGTLAETVTACQYTGNRGVDDWFAHPEVSRVEFEQVLGLIGKRMADELTADHRFERCTLRRREGGEIVLE